LKENGHHGRHKYTTSTTLSRRTCLRLLDCLTSGNIKSLAGLDDEDVEKGRNNFKNLRSLTERVLKLGTENASILSTIDHLHDSILDGVMEMIDSTEDFHAAGFIDHIKDPQYSMYKCTCLPCGFHSCDDNIKCKQVHIAVCSRCTESFATFPLLERMIDNLKKLHHAEIEDELLFCEHKLKKYRQNLIDYRAHLVLKFDEKEAEKDQMLSLQTNQAIVYCDWKMKILAAFHRESQKMFFGKRGTSLLGFMVVSYETDILEIDGETLKSVQFHFFLTDNTTQDNVSVNAAKCMLYEKFLPKHVNQVHFRSDGAGCFACNLTKICIVNWEKWTGIREISNTQSPAGGGKTNLDGSFGLCGRKLVSRVNDGEALNNYFNKFFLPTFIAPNELFELIIDCLF